MEFIGIFVRRNYRKKRPAQAITNSGGVGSGAQTST
jgi:hypothetical protein